MVDVNTQNKTISVNVSSSGVSSNVNASSDASSYYSNKAREWAISNRIVDGVDYSSKYYANISKTNALQSAETRELLQGEYNEYSQNLSDIATTEGNNAISAIQAQQTTSVNAVKTEGTTQVNLAKAQATAAADSATQASNVVKEVEEDLASKVDIDDMVAVDLPSPRSIGEYVWSSVPLTDAALHLPDGTILDGNGIYKDFVNVIADRYSKYPSLFVSETDWQAGVEQYGACGKYVYNASANTVRLPKVTGFVEGTLDVNALGDLVEAGLPQHTHSGSVTIPRSYESGGSLGNACLNEDYGDENRTFSLSIGNASNDIYGKSNTVQPQSILGYMYIVVATTTKTDVEVDIDNVATDLNNKVDVSNMVNAGSYISACAMPNFTVKTLLTAGATGTSYTAPASGIFHCLGQSTAVGGEMVFGVVDLSTGVAAGSNFNRDTAYKNGQFLTSFINVKKGDVVQLYYTNTTIKQFQFIYSEGEVNE